MTVGGVYDHQRQTSSDKRVFILTRSAFAGQQRYGANTWSGDTGSSWENLRNQIPAGLNFSLTGIRIGIQTLEVCSLEPTINLPVTKPVQKNLFIRNYMFAGCSLVPSTQ